ncbi:MAG TPA: hypothetical protein VHS06_04185 [Chloroflexota bacterium]|nr:hypothetical protein [Chloroflexota bacterium]
MIRTTQLPVRKGSALSLSGLRRRERSITVRIFDGGHEVDSFQLSTAQLLRSEMDAIYAHLPKRDATVLFHGVEVESLPLGIMKARREVELDNISAALSFLNN